MARHGYYVVDRDDETESGPFSLDKAMRVAALDALEDAGARPNGRGYSSIIWTDDEGIEHLIVVRIELR
jgi:hypothetical protein